LPITNQKFVLYTGPLSVTKSKKEDLVGLCPYLPELKRFQYQNLKVNHDENSEDESESGEKSKAKQGDKAVMIQKVRIREW
jgi:hypothetical protein